MTNITNILAREILDSRGNPTIEVEVVLTDNTIGRASVPSGASTGSREAIELRDQELRFAGKGVNYACENVRHRIKPLLLNKSCLAQRELDNLMLTLDASSNKSNLGANAILGVSMAIATAAAKHCATPLYQYLHTTYGVASELVMPMPMFNVINGGEHADNNLSIQEFMICPVGARDIMQALEMTHNVISALRKILKDQRLNTNVGDEGGFAPNLNSNAQAIEMILQAIELCGLDNNQVKVCLDVAASEFFINGQYELACEHKSMNSSEFVAYLSKLCGDYNLLSIEDPLDENDWQGWQELTQAIGSEVQIVGDDLFVTNSQLLQKGIELNAANAILIKMNQIGTLSETMDTIALANKHKYNCIISHRSGETEDTFIADLAVASGVGMIKTGSLCRSDRVAKYNQLLRIYESLYKQVKFYK